MLGVPRGTPARLREPHPDSLIRTGDGRAVPLKTHRCVWSGAHPENSLPAIAECFHVGVARAEIDLQPLHDADFLVLHDTTLASSTTGAGPAGNLTRREAQALRLRFAGEVSPERPPLFSDVVRLIRNLSTPTVLELDLVTFQPLPWPRVEELVSMVQPVKDRVFLNGVDWNMRRVLEVDATLAVAYDLLPHLDWLPEGAPVETEGGLPRGAYGYLDAHPLARERSVPTAEYLADRLGVLARLVPGARELHVRLELFERMLADDIAVGDLIHSHGLQLDVWTLNADAPEWRTRFARVLTAGADIVTSDTPRALAAAGRTT